MPLEELLIIVYERREYPDASVVNEYVHTPEGFEHPLQEHTRTLSRGHVCQYPHSLRSEPARFLHTLIQLILPLPSVENNPATLPSKPKTYSPPNSPTRTSHNRDPTLQIIHNMETRPTAITFTQKQHTQPPPWTPTRRPP